MFGIAERESVDVSSVLTGELLGDGVNVCHGEGVFFGESTDN